MLVSELEDEKQTAIENSAQATGEVDLLRLSTAGSVDDGKSTLIGRLLYESKGIYEDQLASIQKSSVNRSSGAFDLSLLTDGLRAEREQGITIDVAYRYFSTPKRKFIIADTPGHEQYTRNMATGASTANLAIILVDARNGILPQSRRHAFIASMLGIQHIVVAVNKMDLVDYDESVFARICSDFRDFAFRLQVPDLHFIPISALKGDNVVEKSPDMPWFDGSSLLHHLETVHIASDRNYTEFRFPVQYVLRPNLDFRGYAGQIVSGVVKKGDPIQVLPSGQTSRVRSIVTYDGELEEAFTPMSVTLCLEDEIDISRGDMLVLPAYQPLTARRIDARMVWMHERPMEVGRNYLLKHTTQMLRAIVQTVRYRINVGNLEKEDACALYMNDMGAVVIETQKPLFCDPYRRNRATGSFILIDPISNETVAAGMITGRTPITSATGGERPLEIARRVSRVDHEQRAGHRALTIWMEEPAAVAYEVERLLFNAGCRVHAISAAEAGPALPYIASALNETGAIVIVFGPEAVKPQLAKIESSLYIGASDDDEDTESGARRILRILEKEGLVKA